jgi:hypothetical protein
MIPWFKNPRIEKNPGPFKVGDRVRYKRGLEPVEGVIVEDRGPLGIGGRRLYAVRVQLDEWNAIVTELPVSELQLVAPSAKDGASEALS